MSSSLPLYGLWPCLSPWDSPGKNTGVGCHSLLQGIFSTQESNPRPALVGRFFTTSATWEAWLDKAHPYFVSDLFLLKSTDYRFYFKKYFIFIYFWPCCVFIMHRLSLVEESRGSSLVAMLASHCGGFSFCRAWALGHSGCSSCGMCGQHLWLPGSGEQAQRLRPMGLVALQHVGSSRIRDWPHVSCTDRWVLYDWATWKAQLLVDFSHIYKMTFTATPRMVFK